MNRNKILIYSIILGIATSGIMTTRSYADQIETSGAAYTAQENEEASGVDSGSEESEADASVKSNAELRQSIVEYALSFVGGRYMYGGNDPHSGVDCSGFTRYILAQAAGVQLPRSSASQAGVGITVDQNSMKPGDLIFYSNGRRVNHAALYIGNGKIVHASGYRTGITVSNWNYRAPARIANMIGS